MRSPEAWGTPDGLEVWTAVLERVDGVGDGEEEIGIWGYMCGSDCRQELH